MKEIWKDIKGYEGYYQVSNLGNVKGIDRIITSKTGKKINRKGQMMKQKLDRHGYPVVHLRRDGVVSKYLKVHRLVAIAFIPNPNNYPIIKHKDENPLNSNCDNLEWCDYTYNNNYGTRNFKLSLTKSKPIFQYSLKGEFIKRFDSLMDIRKHGFNSSAVLNCCNGTSKTSQGYIWKKIIE